MHSVGGPEAASQIAPTLCIRLLGSFEILRNGLPVPRARSRTEQWLLALLVLRGTQGEERSSIAGTLWPDSREEQAHYNLRRSLSNLRQVLGAESVRLHSPTPRTIAFDRAGISCDLIAFDAAMERGDTPSLECAVGLYRGALLPECEEAWLLPERNIREIAWLTALETLAGRAMQTGNPRESLSFLRRVLAADPYRETALRSLMEALDASGNRAEAILAYRNFRLLLNDQLQVEPASETAALYQRLRETGSSKDRGSVRPAPRGRRDATQTAVLRLHIPRPVLDLVGREEERAEIAALLSSCRLVTLTGFGGIGKTRLALAVAEEVVEQFPDGIWFVDLASLSDSDSVPQAVAAKLGVREEAGRSPLETLVTFLAERRLLVLLDNCEHLLSACAALVTALLEPLPKLRVLATSRQALGITGEHAWQVPALLVAPSLSPLSGRSLTTSLLNHAGSRLFVERAREASSAFTLTESNAPSVLQICRRLDGIPLAIELAAARVKVLSVEQIDARLEDAFPLLTGGSRTAQPRHQTLRALVDWSYALLTEKEIRVFRRLSVFADGWTLEAAEAICHDERGSEQEAGNSNLLCFEDVLDLLASLIDKSLIVVEEEPGGQVRYRFLETIRQYAREKLHAAGEYARLRARHRDYFLHRIEQAAPQLEGAGQVLCLDRLATDYANFCLALDWCSEEVVASIRVTDDESPSAPPAELGLRLASGLWRLWEIRGNASEGRARLARILAHPDARNHTLARANVLNGAGMLAWTQGDFEEAVSLFEQSLVIFQEYNDTRGIATALGHVGITKGKQGDHEAERALMQKSLVLWRNLRDPWGTALALGNLGSHARLQGDYPTARAFQEESLILRRELGDQWGIATALDNLGTIAYEQGDYALARTNQDASLRLRRQLGEKAGIADALGNLGLIAMDQSDYAAAQAYQEESLALRRELGDRCGIALALGNLGIVMLELGDFVAARALQEESLGIRRRLGNKEGIALSLANLGNQAYDEGDFTSAYAFMTESLELFRALGNRWATTYLLHSLGSVLHARKDCESAFSCLSECLILCREIDNKRVTALGLEGVAHLALTQGQWERSVLLYAAAEKLRQSLNCPLSSRERKEYDRIQKEYNLHANGSALSAARAQGAAMTLEQAIAFALIPLAAGTRIQGQPP